MTPQGGKGRLGVGGTRGFGMGWVWGHFPGSERGLGAEGWNYKVLLVGQLWAWSTLIWAKRSPAPGGEPGQGENGVGTGIGVTPAPLAVPGGSAAPQSLCLPSFCPCEGERRWHRSRDRDPSLNPCPNHPCAALQGD